MSPIDAFSSYQNNVNANLLVSNDSVTEIAQDLRSTEHMSKGLKRFLNVITLGIAGHFIDKHERAEDARVLKQCAQDMVTFKNKLEGLEEGRNQGFLIKMGDSYAQVEQSDTNVISCLIEGQNFGSPFTAKELVTKIEDDMVNNIELYGKNSICTLLDEKKDSQTDLSTAPSRDRELCLRVLHNLANFEEQDFQHTPTSLLHTFALNALNTKDFNPEKIAQFHLDVQNAHHIASEEAQGLLDKLSSAVHESTEEVHNKVTIESLRAPAYEAVGNAVTAPSADRVSTWKDVHNFAADLICNEDSQVYDKNLETAGARIKQTFTEHAATLADIVKNRDLLNTLPEPLRNAVNEALQTIESTLVEHTGQDLSFVHEGLIRTGLSHMPESLFAPCEKAIDSFSQEASQGIQALVNTQFARIFSTEATPVEEAPAEIEAAPAEVANVDADAVPDVEGDAVPDAEGNRAPHGPKSPEDIIRETAILDNMLKGGGDAESGQVQFMNKVFSKYFENIPPLDQRNILAASIRYAKADDSEGARLGAMLKGTGPIMQKMLQGFNTTNMDPEMKIALDDMKDSLASIHPNVVEAHLLDMVERSQGEVTNITVERSLGAASVGQAFLCNMTLRDGTKEECVIKLLRPDVQNRAFREKALFVEASKEVPGMEVTFGGQLNRIMEELDLTLEAANVKKGAVYDGGLGGAIESMKLSPLIEPTQNTMVLEKAPGTTLASYVKSTHAQIEKILEGAGGTEDLGSILERKQALETLYKDVKQRQQHLATLSAAWVNEGVFGAGFYHGDLHAGNIMTDTDKMTVIDFGNATSLNKDQQGCVTRLMCGACIANTKMFLKAYQELLSPEGKELFAAKNTEIRQTVDDIMQYGGTSQTGQRIAVVLTKLQNLGLELPAPIYNFSHCQIRLQGALDSVNSLMNDIIEAMSETGTTFKNTQMPLGMISSEPLGEIDRHASKASIMKSIERARHNTEVDVPNFKTVLRTILPDEVDFAKQQMSADYTTILSLIDDCARAYGTDQFDALVERVGDELTAINEQQLQSLEDFIQNQEVKVRPQDFCECMSGVISEHLSTVVNQLGIVDSLKVRFYKV